MTTTPIAAGPLDVTVRAQFEQWYLRQLRGNPANLELDESGEYKYLPTLFLAFEAGMVIEREACANLCEEVVTHPAGHGGQWEGYGPVKTQRDGKACAGAIRARSNAEVSGCLRAPMPEDAPMTAAGSPFDRPVGPVAGA